MRRPDASTVVLAAAVLLAVVWFWSLTITNPPVFDSLPLEGVVPMT